MVVISLGCLAVALIGFRKTLAFGDPSNSTRVTTTEPAWYAAIRAKDPAATFLNVPQFPSGSLPPPTAGDQSTPDIDRDNRVLFNSPFSVARLGQPEYLANPRVEYFEFARRADFRSYVWLYLTVHDFRYVVVPRRLAASPDFAAQFDRLEVELDGSEVFEDAATVVYDRERMPRPTTPVFLYVDGWGNRVGRDRRRACMLGRSGRVVVFNPTPDRVMTFTLDASANRSQRTVILRSGGEDLARWEVPAKGTSLLASPPFRLTEGLHEMILLSDGVDRPSRSDAHVEGDSTPFSLYVTGIGLEAALPQAVAGRRMGPGLR